MVKPCVRKRFDMIKLSVKRHYLTLWSLKCHQFLTVTFFLSLQDRGQCAFWFLCPISYGNFFLFKREKKREASGGMTVFECKKCNHSQITMILEELNTQVMTNNNTDYILLNIQWFTNIINEKNCVRSHHQPVIYYFPHHALLCFISFQFKCPGMQRQSNKILPCVIVYTFWLYRKFLGLINVLKADVERVHLPAYEKFSW